jgi:hypothetical protein
MWDMSMQAAATSCVNDNDTDHDDDDDDDEDNVTVYNPTMGLAIARPSNQKTKRQ